MHVSRLLHDEDDDDRGQVLRVHHGGGGDLICVHASMSFSPGEFKERVMSWRIRRKRTLKFAELDKILRKHIHAYIKILASKKLDGCTSGAYYG